MPQNIDKEKSKVRTKKVIPQTLRYGEALRNDNVDAGISSHKWKLLIRNSVGSAGAVITTLFDSRGRRLMMAIVDTGVVVTCHFNDFRGISVQVSATCILNNASTFNVSLAVVKETETVQMSPIRQARNKYDADNKIDLFFLSPDKEPASFVPRPNTSKVLINPIKDPLSEYDWHSTIILSRSRTTLSSPGRFVMDAYVHDRCTRQAVLGPIARADGGVEFIMTDIANAQIRVNADAREDGCSQPSDAFVKFIESGPNEGEESIYDAGLYGNRIKVFIYLYDHDFTYPISP